MSIKQVPPGNRAKWEHVDYDKHSATVTFRHKETGATVQCPNVWYNQPVEARISAYEFYEAQAKKQVARCEQAVRDGIDRYADNKLKEARARLAQCQRGLETMRKTGKGIE